MNAIHFKITCSNIKDKFELFFNNSITIKDQIISPGIHFARLALLSIGGDVTYQFGTNDYVEITILVTDSSEVKAA